MRNPLPLEEAQARLLALAVPLPVEEVPVEGALERFLAEPLIARRTHPAADVSAMDGYAVSGAGPWQIVGESRAGHPFGGALAAGQAARISTGAILPDGAEAIVLIEDAIRDEGTLAISETPEPGHHIRRRGFDFTAGDQLASRGARVTPALVALARSAGHAAVAVRRKPRVAILDSGDELVADPLDCPDDRIPASNGAMLAAMVPAVPCEVVRIGPAADDRDVLSVALGCAEDCDVLVTSGGASVGEHDLIRPALEAWGAELDFWRVAIRPGKPLIVARRGAQVVLGLPGNPVSSYVTAFLFLLPLLRAMSGAAAPLPRMTYMPLAADLPPGDGRREFLRAGLAEGALMPINERDSSALRALAGADALIDRESGAAAKPAGALVPAFLLENGGIA